MLGVNQHSGYVVGYFLKYCIILILKLCILNPIWYSGLNSGRVKRLNWKKISKIEMKSSI